MEVLEKWLKAILWSEDDSFDSKQFAMQITRLVGHHRRLVVGRKHQQLNSFNGTTYSLPTSASRRLTPLNGEPQSPQIPQAAPKTVSKQDYEAVQTVNEEFAREASVLKITLQKKEEEIGKMQEKLKKYNPKNARKREKRKQEKIDQQRKELMRAQKYTECIRAMHDAQTKEEKALHMQLAAKHAAAQRYKQRWLYWKSKAQTTVVSEHCDSMDSCSDDEHGLAFMRLKRELAELEKMNIELNDQVRELTAMTMEVKTIEGGKFLPIVTEVCIDLLARNVGIRHVSPIIKLVVEKLTGQKIDRLPSCATLANLTTVAKLVSYQQIGEELQGKENVTLHCDGTTKFGDKYISYQISAEDSAYSIGLADMQAGTALQTLDIFKGILQEVERVCNIATGRTNVGAQTLSTVKNTMSDRHIVQKNFNQLLQAYREEALPVIITNWSELTAVQQKALASMNHFFCGLHFLVGLADTASEVLKQWEMIHDDDTNDSESGTVRLVRTTCKAIHRRGCAKSGCYITFREFLRDKGIDSIPLAAFKGNRFNIIFYDGGGVFYLHEHLREFFTKSYVTSNRLLQSVNSDINNPIYIAGCKALGIINKLVTGPLWRLLESNVSITDMSAYYVQMVERFEAWASDASDLLHGKDTLFADEELLHSDAVMEALMKEHPDDDIVTECLQLVMKSFEVLAHRMLEDHLKGGQYHSPDSHLQMQTESVPTTNAISERDFGKFDRLLREKPHATTLAIEAMILYSNNKTSEWLQTKTEGEKKEIFEVARKMAPSHRKLFKERLKEIQAYRRHQLQVREEELARKQQKEQREREELLTQIHELGYWRAKATVTEQLCKMKTIAQKKAALKVQLKYRRKVLQQQADKELFLFSKQSKPYSVQTLTQNLFQLIDLSSHEICMPSMNDTVEEPPSKRKRPDPSTLCGKFIQHRFKEADGSLTWYSGYIVKQIGDKNSWEFVVSYDDEEEECHFNLETDIDAGDIRFV